MPVGTKGQSPRQPSISLRKTIPGAGGDLASPASCVLRSARCSHDVVLRELAPVLGAIAVPLERLCDISRHSTIRDFMAASCTRPHCPLRHARIGMTPVLAAPVDMQHQCLAPARLDFSSPPPLLSLSGSRASFSLYFPVVACTVGPTLQPKSLSDALSHLLCPVVLATAPLRSLRPWPSHRLPGSTPQSHVVGVGCGRIALAIQGSGTGAEQPVQERNGAVAGPCECAGKGSAPQKQMLVQRLSQGFDQRPTGARGRYKQPTRSADGGARTTREAVGGVGAFAAFTPWCSESRACTK